MVKKVAAHREVSLIHCTHLAAHNDYSSSSRDQMPFSDLHEYQAFKCYIVIHKIVIYKVKIKNNV